MGSTKKLSRRRIVQGLGVIVASGISAAAQPRDGTPWAAPREASSAGRPRVLALIGDRYHNADFIRVALDRVFRELDLSVEYTIARESISASLLSDYRLFVCFRDGMVWPKGYLEPNDYEYSHELENTGDWPKETFEPWITEQQGKAVEDFVAWGNGFYALHNSSNISLYSKHFRSVMGGAYIGHPPLRPFKVRVVNKEHPITRGVEDFMVNDEQHFVTYDKDPKDIILRSENIDGLTYEGLGAESVAGWAYEFGKGRVVFTAVGHTLHAMWNSEYLKIQKNALRWLLKMS